MGRLKRKSSSNVLLWKKEDKKVGQEDENQDENQDDVDEDDSPPPITRKRIKAHRRNNANYIPVLEENDRGQLVNVDREDNTSTGFQWTQSLHPLLIPDIIVNVMCRLEFSDFRNTSLVCSEWKAEWLRMLPSRGKVTLNSFANMTQFMRQNEDVSRNKFSHFRLSGNLNLQDPIMQRFFSKFGPFIQYLHLDWIHWIPASLRKILFEKLPLLEELVICSQRLTEIGFLPSPSPVARAEQVGGYLTVKLPNVKILRIEAAFDNSNCQFLLELLSVLPNLTVVSGFNSVKEKTVSNAPTFSRIESLRYEQWDNRTDRMLDSPDADLLFSKILHRHRLVNNYKQLTSLKMVFDIDAMTYLRQGELPLETLEVVVPSQTFASWHPRPSHLFNHILSYSRTLTSLKINYCSGKIKLFTIFDGISRLRNLRHLTLHRVSGCLDFLCYLPQLKSLHMTQEDFIDYYDEFHVEESRPHKLESLKLYYTSWSVSSLYVELPRPAKILNVVQIIVQRFPQLKCFRMESLTDKALTVIYNCLPGLEELEATNGSFTSAGISGVPVVNQAQIHFQGLIRKNPYIGCLDNLKKLRLESNKMTDYGVVSSVTQLPSLTHLTLVCYKLTDESLWAVVRKLGLKVLKTEFCYEFSESVVQWAKKILKERGSKVMINPFCGSMEIEKVHEFLNENGPIHISIPDFPVNFS